MSSSLSLLDKVSIAILVIYTPVFVISLALCGRRGHGRFLPWMFLCFFAVIRLVGGALQLSTISNTTSKSLKLYVGARLCTWIGLHPLYLATLFTLGNILAPMKSRHPRHFFGMTPTYHEIVVTVTLTASFILGIVGVLRAGNSFEKRGKYTTPGILESSAIICIPAFIALLDATVFLDLRMRRDGESCPKSLVIVCVASLPLLAVRLVYQILMAFSTDSTFYLFGGSSGFFIGMAVVEEMVVGTALAVAGFLGF